MTSLPNELKIQIFQDMQHSESIGINFDLGPNLSMNLVARYISSLVNNALVCKDWTGIAQSELFRHVVVTNEEKMDKLLRLLRSDGRFRNYAKRTISVRIGRGHDLSGVEGMGKMYEGGERLKSTLHELALYCRHGMLTEISCGRISSLRLEYLSKCHYALVKRN
jgi:hypothetical protein